MKTLSALVAGLFFLLITLGVQAQTKAGADYFTGKWNVLVTGTPYGDLKRIYLLEKSGNTLTGSIQDTTGKQLNKCSKVEVKDNEVILYYHLYYEPIGNFVRVRLTKKDDDHVTVSMLGKFDVKGERLKQ